LIFLSLEGEQIRAFTRSVLGSLDPNPSLRGKTAGIYLILVLASMVSRIHPGSP
jgi:hypothetical protein